MMMINAHLRVLAFFVTASFFFLFFCLFPVFFTLVDFYYGYSVQFGFILWFFKSVIVSYFANVFLFFQLFLFVRMERDSLKNGMAGPLDPKQNKTVIAVIWMKIR